MCPLLLACAVEKDSLLSKCQHTLHIRKPRVAILKTRTVVSACYIHSALLALLEGMEPQFFWIIFVAVLVFASCGLCSECYVCSDVAAGNPGSPASCPDVNNPKTTVKRVCPGVDACLTFRGRQKIGNVETNDGVYRSCWDAGAREMFKIASPPAGNSCASFASSSSFSSTGNFGTVTKEQSGQLCLCRGSLCNRENSSTGNNADATAGTMVIIVMALISKVFF